MLQCFAWNIVKIERGKFEESENNVREKHYADVFKAYILCNAATHKQSENMNICQQLKKSSWHAFLQEPERTFRPCPNCSQLSYKLPKLLIQILKRLTRIKAIKKWNFNFVRKEFRVDHLNRQQRNIKNLSSKHNKGDGNSCHGLKSTHRTRFSSSFSLFCLLSAGCQAEEKRRICIKLIFQ